MAVCEGSGRVRGRVMEPPFFLNFEEAGRAIQGLYDLIHRKKGSRRAKLSLRKKSLVYVYGRVRRKRCRER